MTPGAAQTTSRKRFRPQRSGYLTRIGDLDAGPEITILRMIYTVKSRLVKLALTVGSVLTALLAGAANLKIT